MTGLATHATLNLDQIVKVIDKKNDFEDDVVARISPLD